MKSFNFIIEKTKTGYSAYCESAPVFTSGRTIHDLQNNALEAINLFLSESGKSVGTNKLSFEFDFRQFFDFYKVINSKHLASRIGMNESLLSQYVTGKKKPSKKQVSRLVAGLHEIGKELMELTLV
ncbi:MAG: XRE family transcriptional regulator [Saprospiraceae bacterium]|nr:XRE family transcriptional regulator [Saprospiraceae bacterium]